MGEQIPLAREADAHRVPIAVDQGLAHWSGSLSGK